MDGVLVDTEHLWDEVREALTEEWGGRYTPEAQEAMMGMSSPEWSRYLHETVGLPAPRRDQRRGRAADARAVQIEFPVVPGAVDAVRRLARGGSGSRWRRRRTAVDRRGAARLELTRLFEATVSSEEVERGKPAPDVYLEAARQLGVDPACVAVEDSASGIRAAHAAGMRVIAYPNWHYPPARRGARARRCRACESLHDVDTEAHAKRVRAPKGPHLENG